MKAKLIQARDLSGQIDCAAFILYLHFSLLALEKPDSGAKLNEVLDIFDRIFEVWEGLMDHPMINALELSGIEPFRNKDSIAFDYITARRSKICNAIIACYSEEHLLSLGKLLPNELSHCPSVAWLWRNSQNLDRGTAKSIAQNLKEVYREKSSSESSRVRLEYNAAIRALSPQQSAKKLTIGDRMVKVISRNIRAVGWELSEWCEELELKDKKSSISSCVVYRSELLRRARSAVKADPSRTLEHFEKDVNNGRVVWK